MGRYKKTEVTSKGKAVTTWFISPSEEKVAIPTSDQKRAAKSCSDGIPL